MIKEMPIGCAVRKRGLRGMAILWLPVALVSSVHVSAETPTRILEVPSHAENLLLATAIELSAAEAATESWRLVELDAPNLSVTAQTSHSAADDGDLATDQRQLLAEIPPRADAPPLRTFELRAAPQPGRAAPDRLRFKDVSDVSLGLWQGDAPVLVYNHGRIVNPEVPATDHRRSRGCYLHPVYGLKGEVLTDDFPPDHFHHHGVFWTWPHVRVDGQDHDLWAGASIEQRFVRWLARDVGPVAAVLGVENGWFVGEKQVMIERVWLRVFRSTAGSRSLDISLVLIPTDQPVKLLGAAGKSYGGLTMRFAPPKGKDPSTRITTPDGIAQADLSVARLPWADFSSKLNGAPFVSGGAIFVHPEHPDFPPTWLLRHYGPLCVGWPGVVSRTLAPQDPVRLEYRLWIHQSTAEVAEIQSAFAAYQAVARAKIRPE